LELHCPFFSLLGLFGNFSELFERVRAREFFFDSLKDILRSEYGLKFQYDFFFDRYLARGLDYYSGLIFELLPSNKPGQRELSIGGGGRYDNLIGMFSKKKIPAVGFSFGIDRIIDALDLLAKK